jgi:MFS family permease
MCRSNYSYFLDAFSTRSNIAEKRKLLILRFGLGSGKDLASYFPIRYIAPKIIWSTHRILLRILIFFMNSSELKSAISIALLYVFRMLGLFMVLPVLPLYGDTLSGATPALIGIALGIYGLSQALLQIPFGYLSDRMGRKTIIVCGLLIFISGSVVAAQAETVYGVIAGRFLQGAGAIASTMMALLSDLTRIEQRTKAMAILGISIGISFAVSLVLGPFINLSYGLSGIFWTTAALGIVGLLIVALLIPTPGRQVNNRDSGFVLAEFSKVISAPGLLRVDMGIFMLHFNLMASFVGFPLVLQGTGELADQQHYLVYLSLLIASFVVMAPLMMLSDRSRWTKQIMMLCVAMLVAGYMIVAGNLHDLWGICVGLFLFFMAFNFLEVVFPSFLSKLAPAGTRGTAMGAYSTMQFLGAFFGGLVGGWILSEWDLSVLYQVNAALCLVWFVSYFSMRQPKNISSRTLNIEDLKPIAANRLQEELLSLVGVEEVVIIESDNLAYLKVDDHLFDDSSGATLIATS